MTKPSTPKTIKKTKPAKRRRATKSDKIICLLRRPSGATIANLQKATGWQAHSVRGFLSATVKKRLGLELLNEKDDRAVRRYRITESDGAQS